MSSAYNFLLSLHVYLSRATKSQSPCTAPITRPAAHILTQHFWLSSQVLLPPWNSGNTLPIAEMVPATLLSLNVGIPVLPYIDFLLLFQEILWARRNSFKSFLSDSSKGNKTDEQPFGLFRERQYIFIARVIQTRSRKKHVFVESPQIFVLGSEVFKEYRREFSSHQWL